LLHVNGGPASLPAVIAREPRQARKGATVASDSGAGVRLAGSAALRDPLKNSVLEFFSSLQRGARPRCAPLLGEPPRSMPGHPAPDGQRRHRRFLASP